MTRSSSDWRGLSKSRRKRQSCWHPTYRWCATKRRSIYQGLPTTNKGRASILKHIVAAAFPHPNRFRGHSKAHRVGYGTSSRSPALNSKKIKSHRYSQIDSSTKSKFVFQPLVKCPAASASRVFAGSVRLWQHIALGFAAPGRTTTKSSRAKHPGIVHISSLQSNLKSWRIACAPQPSKSREGKSIPTKAFATMDIRRRRQKK